MASAVEIQARNESLLALGPLDPNSFSFEAFPPPTSDNAKCKLSVIRTGILSNVPKDLVIMGAESSLSVVAYAFLLEKEQQGETIRIIYDLGLRETSKHTHPRYLRLGKLWNVQANAGVAEILKANGIALETISHLILSHAHFDHIGNVADFPDSLPILVGPESPVGEELATELDVPIDVIKDRAVRELSREKDKWQMVGSFQGYDYFGDGSFWLLDVPGHKPGHIAALVRTSTNPPVYHILGGDTAHAPHLLSQEPPTKNALFPQNRLNPAGDERILMSMHADLAQTYASQAKMRRLDMEENVNVCLAHDVSMEFVLGSGDLIGLEGTLDELKTFKGRDRLRTS